MKLLGHKDIANTLIYTQLVEFEENDKFCTARLKMNIKAQSVNHIRRETEKPTRNPFLAKNA